MTLTFADLRAANDARAKQWNPTGPAFSLEFAMMELAGEVGEACNIAKKMTRARMGVAGGQEDYVGLAEELADVVICADLAARKLGINLGAEVARKFNKTSRKHGFTVMLPEPSEAVQT